MTLEDQLLGFLQNVESKIKQFDEVQTAVDNKLKELDLAMKNGQLEIDISNYEIIRDIQAQSKKMDDTITNLKTQTANFGASVSANNSKVTKIEEEQAKANTRIDGLSTTSVTHGARLNDIDSSISSIQTSIATLESAITTNKNAIDLLQENIESLRSQIQNA